MDLSKITTPFGLLDKETQDALRKFSDGLEWYDGHDWLPTQGVTGQANAFVHRVRPAPPKPRELWHVLDENGEVFDTFTERSLAHDRTNDCSLFTLVHYREVKDGEAQ